ncbi:MAG: 2-dehydropantoate 2-reductase [Dehalococcoidia bacterium]|nr:2-dehydropantoate 2-reductase [Dehalococcoidia bacterium]
MAKIAVIGSGAVGCYYGGLLARAGHDVRFLMRRDLAAVRASGLDIRSPEGDFRLEHVSAFASSEEIGPADWVICSLKSTAFGAAPELIAPCIGPDTRILALMNGLGVEEQIAGWFGPERVFGGMAFVCINRGQPGVVHHLRYGRVTIGHHLDDAAQVEELRAMLAGARFDVVAAPALRAARWEKLCWNVPFNGLSVAGGGIGTELICRDEELRPLAERVMREVVAVANADLAAAGKASRLDPGGIVAQLFALTDTMGDYRTSMALDYVAGRPLEVEAIHGNVARRARELGVAAPAVDALYALVRTADLRRRGLVPAISEAEAAALSD